MERRNFLKCAAASPLIAAAGNAEAQALDCSLNTFDGIGWSGYKEPLKYSWGPIISRLTPFGFKFMVPASRILLEWGTRKEWTVFFDYIQAYDALAHFHWDSLSDSWTDDNYARHRIHSLCEKYGTPNKATLFKYSVGVKQDDNCPIPSQTFNLLSNWQLHYRWMYPCPVCHDVEGKA